MAASRRSGWRAESPDERPDRRDEPSALAPRTEVCRAGALGDTVDRGGADDARLSFAVVDGEREVFGLPESAGARIRSDSRFHSLAHDGDDRPMQRPKLGTADAADRLPGSDARPEQRLGGVDVAQSGDAPLVHQEQLGGLA